MNRNMRTAILLLSMAMLTACGGPRPAELRGDVCRSIATDGHAPYPWPDVLRSPNAMLAAAQRVGPIDIWLPAESSRFRDDLARRLAARARRDVPARVLAVSAGGAWGSFSLGFSAGWAENTTEPRPQFDVVTGVSTGAMIAPIVFLNDPAELARLRDKYKGLTDPQVFTKRSFLSLLSSTSLYDTAPLRGEVEKIVTEDLVRRLAVEYARNRTLAVMAVNLDAGVPWPFDLTKVAADATKTSEERRRRIIDAIMASAAVPIAFPPVFIDGDMYVDGGARKHVFIVQTVVAAVMGKPAGDDGAGLKRYSVSFSGPPIDLTMIVSGDMKVMRDCVGDRQLDLLRMVDRTSIVVTDQTLRDSVELLLLQIGQSPANTARFIDASRLVNYPKVGDAALRQGPCEVPSDNDDQFNPTFQDCLDREGYNLGKLSPIPWKLPIKGGRIMRAPNP